MLGLTFLGTSAGVPSRDRTMSCVAVKQGKAVTLFDCAEGTQRQLMVSRLSFMKVGAIFISHLHGDHMLGLPGLLQTMGMSGRKDPLIVCGPEGLASALDSMMRACDGTLEYDCTVTELGDGDSVRLPSATVTAFATDHGVPSLGYVYREDDGPGRFDRARAVELGIRPGPDFTRLQNGEAVNGVEPSMVIGPPRKGMCIVYTGDTLPGGRVAEMSVGADVLIHESTYGPDEAELAPKYFHSTCMDAARTAAECGVRYLFLTHFSNRYDDVSVLEAAAREVFPETRAANDLDSYEISEKGLTQV